MVQSNGILYFGPVPTNGWHPTVNALNFNSERQKCEANEEKSTGNVKLKFN